MFYIGYLYFKLIRVGEIHTFFSELFISNFIYLALILSLTNCVTMDSYLIFPSLSFHIFKVQYLTYYTL